MKTGIFAKIWGKNRNPAEEWFYSALMGCIMHLFDAYVNIYRIWFNSFFLNKHYFIGFMLL